MKNIACYIYCFAVLCMSACTPQEEKVTATESKDSTLVINSIIDPETGKKATLEEFPADWVMLTSIDNGYVVHQYCDVENSTIHIEKNEQGYLLTLLLGQAKDHYKITQLNYPEAGHYELICQAVSGEESRMARINYQKGPNHLAEWTWVQTSSDEVVVPLAVYVEKGYEGEYPVVREQDCD